MRCKNSTKDFEKKHPSSNFPKPKPIKAVIFDIGGVLQIGGRTRISKKEIHTSGVHQMIARKLNISLDQYFDAIDTHYAKSIEGQITKQTLLSVLSLNLNYPKDKLEKLYLNAYKKKFKKNIGLYNLAKKLKKQGYKIAILSDQWHLSKDALLPKKDIKIFDTVVTSCDVGMRKPNISIYELTLKKLKVEPGETIFIDNQAWNIFPAHNLGMNTILYHDNKKTKEQLEEFGIKV
jgi:putative hydrolase of the HAD superfamily